MAQLVFTVHARPEAQGSIRMVPTRRGMRLTSTNRELKGYRLAVAQAAALAMHAAGVYGLMADKHVPVEMVIEFMFWRPKSTERRWPVVKPDIDKLERAVLDALTGIVYLDDAQVVRVSKEKVYGPVEQTHVSLRLVAE